MAEINDKIVVEKENTTQFANSVKTEVVNVTPHQKSFEEYIKSWSEKGDGAKASQDINSMLSRPGLISTFEWKETDLDDALLTTIDLPTAIQNSKFKSSKMKYFKFVRSNYKIRMVINATRFHAGRLLVVWAPGSSLCSIQELNEKSMASLLCFPSLIIDPATNQTVEFVIPFISPYLYYPLTTYSTGSVDAVQLAGQALGQVKVFVLNKLTSGQTTTTPVSVSVYGWLDEPALSVPLYAQMGVVSDTIDGLVAPMTEIVDTATDVASGASRMLRSVGLSKPDNVGSNIRVTPVVANSLSYGVGSDTIEKLVVDPKCALEPCNELFGTKDDEMDIVYIGKTWSLLKRVDWEANRAHGYVLADLPLFPERDTTAGWMLRAFKYYCGSVRVRIQLVANQFMSGRVMALFVPSQVTIPDITPLTDLADMMYNQVYDLTGTSESEFTIPYNAPYPVLPTPFFAQADASDYVGIDQSSIGNIKLLVLNPLRTTKATNEKAVINVYMSFDDDLEVFWPSLSAVTGTEFKSLVSYPQLEIEGIKNDAAGLDDLGTLFQFPTATTGNLLANFGISESTEENAEIVNFEELSVEDVRRELKNIPCTSQSGRLKAVNVEEKKGKVDKDKVLNQVPVPVQNSRIETMPNPLWVSKREPGFAAKYNFGEKITNLRQVLKRYSAAYYIKGFPLLASSVPPGSSATSVIPYITFSVGAAPFADAQMNSTMETLTASDAFKTISCWTFLSYFGCIYRYQRGGVRVKFLMGTQPNTTAFACPGIPATIGTAASESVVANDFIYAPQAKLLPIFPVSSGAGVNQVKYALNSFYGRKWMSYLSEGCVAASCDINPNLEVEIPYYSPYMMIPTPSGIVSKALWAKMRPASKASLVALKMSRTLTLMFFLGKIPLPDAASTVPSSQYYQPYVPRMVVMESVADDFQFGFLTGPPELATKTVSKL
nr:MAG: capsid protein [Owegonang virus 3]